MSSLKLILLSITILLVLGVKLCTSTVSCTVCPGIKINLTTDTDIKTDGCQTKDEQVCTLLLRIDYTDSENNFVVIDGANESMLLLTNGEPQISETTSIWFDQVKVQRLASINCFARASCGRDRLREIYREEFRPFQHGPIQKQLSDQLYDPAASQRNLTCEDVSGSVVACPDGFCRSIFDGNGFITYSSCIKKGLVAVSYGIIVSKMTMADFGSDQTTGIFTCNRPRCNSKQATRQVLQALVDANLIPKPSSTTTTPATGAGQSFLWSNASILLITLVSLIRSIIL